MRPMNPTKIVTVSLLLATLGAGCSSTTSPNTQRGAVGGAAAGAVLGGIIGHQSGELGKGAAVGAAVGGLAGAAVGNAQDRRVENQQTADRQVGYLIQTPPPAPTSAPYESMPPRPSNDSIWVAGYYDYVGGDQYRWVPGHWEVPPTGYRTWAPPSWQQTGNGYSYVRGHWQ